ncbi:hypothetical protein, partial [Mycobacterium tuberculosis]|uniref:hypothetical protein n=1 Tax=Mycobacterium tuberculosis TaxID=1773 RepID=UPI000AE28763
MGDAPGGTGVGGIGGLLLGLDGANAPASTNPLHTAQQQALAAVNAPDPGRDRAPADRQRRQRRP